MHDQTQQRAHKVKHSFKEQFLFALKTALPLSLFISVTLFLFGPVDLYFSNLNDFAFAFSQFIGPMLVVAAACFAGMTLLLTFFGTLVPKKVLGLAATFVFGLGLAAYLQGTFLSATMEAVNGDSILWILRRNEMFVNTALWLGILFLCLVFYLLKPKTSLKVMRLVCFALVGIQLLTGTVTYFTNEGGNSTQKAYLLKEGVYDLSANKNVIVFMPDTLDTRYFDELLEQAPQALDGLDGFTYYDNMGGTYPTTTTSLVYFFTDEKYINQMPFYDFIKEKLPKSPLLTELKANNFDNRIKCEEPIIDCFSSDNLDNIGISHMEIKSNTAFLKEWLTVTAYRYAPATMRPFFFRDFNTAFNDLISVPRTSGAGVAVARDSTVLEHIRANGLNLMQDKNAFRFLTLRGAHSPFNTNANGEQVPDNSVSRVEAIQGSFKVISTMVDEMKAAGIYDQSAIVIMADHGRYPSLSNPAFLIKYPYEHGELRTSHAPVSQEDLIATLLKAADCTNYADYGTPVDEWPEDAERVRTYYHYIYEPLRKHNMYYKRITEYTYSCDADDTDNYVVSNEY